MNRLDPLRRKIDSLDKKMKRLFIKRMNCSLEVKKIKDELGLEYFDKEREEFVISNNSKDLNSFKNEYIEFLKSILKISKDVMKK